MGSIFLPLANHEPHRWLPNRSWYHCYCCLHWL